MDTKDNTSKNPHGDSQPQEEIHSLVKDLMSQHDQSSPALPDNQQKPINPKTPLDNLKSVLSHIDNAATSAETSTPHSQNPEIITPNPTAIVTHAGADASGPVAQLDKLIKAHRAKI